MNHRAGDQKQGFLWRQEHLAPLPIPTGQAASDLMNLIWRKNDVYLDIGSFPMAAGWMTLHMGTVLIGSIILWLAASGDYWLSLAFFILMGAGLMGTLWYFYIKQWRNPLTPPIRFNRQRREACITRPDGSYWFVPWERVYAIAPSVTNLGTYGASQHGSLVLWFPLEGQIDEAYSETKEGWVMMVNPGGGRSSMAQWECIRSFMEVGPEAVPEPSVVRHHDMTIAQSFITDFKDAVASKGWLLSLLWEGFAGIVVFNIPLYVYFARKKLANLPDLTAPEAIEWSKPLPREQWAKRTPELETAIAQREAELAQQ